MSPNAFGHQQNTCLGTLKHFTPSPFIRRVLSMQVNYRSTLLMVFLAWILTYILLFLDYWSALTASTIFFFLTFPFWHNVLSTPSKRRSVPLLYALLIYTFFVVLRALEYLLWEQQYKIYVLEKTPGFMLLVFLTLMFSIDPRENGYRRDQLLERRSKAMLIIYGIVTGYTVYAIVDALLYVYPYMNALIFTVSTLFFIVNSFFEEYLFRGILYTTLSERLGVLKGGFLVQSLLFGAWHIIHHLNNPISIYSVIHISFTILFALIAATYRYLTGSIAYPILVHTYVNVLSDLENAYTHYCIYSIEDICVQHNMALAFLLTITTLALALYHAAKTKSYRKILKLLKRSSNI